MLSAIMVALILPVQAQAATARTITVFRVDGTNAELFRNGTARSTAPRNNFRINAGNTITTGANTQIYLNFDTNSLLKMDSHSAVNFELTSQLLGINLQGGSALVRVDQQPANTTVEARLGAVAFTVRGTMFTIGYAEEEGIAQIALLSGSGEIGETLIEAGQIVTIDTIDLINDEPFTVDEIDFSELDAFTILEIVNNREYLEENSEFFADAEVWDEVAMWEDAALDVANANDSLPITATEPAPVTPRRSFRDAQARRQVADQARREYDRQNSNNQGNQSGAGDNVYIPPPTAPQPMPTYPPVVINPPTQPPTTTQPPYEIPPLPPINPPSNIQGGGFTGITPQANRTGNMWEIPGPATTVRDWGNSGTIVAREGITQLMPQFTAAPGGNLRHIMVAADYFVGAPLGVGSASFLVNLQNARGFALAPSHAHPLTRQQVENTLSGFWDFLADEIGIPGRLGNIFTETTTPSAINFDTPTSRNFEPIAPYNFDFDRLFPLRTQISSTLNSGNVIAFGAIATDLQGRVAVGTTLDPYYLNTGNPVPVNLDWFIAALVATPNNHNQATLHIWRTSNFPLTPTGGIGSHFIALPIEYVTHPTTNEAPVHLLFTHQSGWTGAVQPPTRTDLTTVAQTIFQITQNGNLSTIDRNARGTVGGTGRTDGIRIREGAQGAFHQTEWFVEIEITTPNFYWAAETLDVLNMQTFIPELWNGNPPITTRYTTGGNHLGANPNIVPAQSGITTNNITGINENTLSFGINIPNATNVNRLVNDEINIRGLQITNWITDIGGTGTVDGIVRFYRAEDDGTGEMQTGWFWQPGESMGTWFDVGAAWAALPVPTPNLNVIVSLENGDMVVREVAENTPLTGNDVMAFHSVPINWRTPNFVPVGEPVTTQALTLANFDFRLNIGLESATATANQLEDEETDKKESEPALTIIHEETPIEPDPDDFLEDTYDLWRNGRFSDVA